MEPLLVDEKEAARLLGLSVQYLQRDRIKPQPSIPFFREGTRCLYSPERLRQWAHDQHQKPFQPRPLPPEIDQQKRKRGRPTKAETLARRGISGDGDIQLKGEGHGV